MGAEDDLSRIGTKSFSETVRTLVKALWMFVHWKLSSVGKTIRLRIFAFCPWTAIIDHTLPVPRLIKVHVGCKIYNNYLATEQLPYSPEQNRCHAKMISYNINS